MVRNIFASELVTAGVTVIFSAGLAVSSAIDPAKAASDVIDFEFGPTLSESSGDNGPTGASGRAIFDFQNLEGDFDGQTGLEFVRVMLTVENTTPSSVGGSTLTGFGFDLTPGISIISPEGDLADPLPGDDGSVSIDGASLAANPFLELGEELDFLVAPDTLQPFGQVELAFLNDSNFSGSSPNGNGLVAGTSETVTFSLSTPTGLTIEEFVPDFFASLSADPSELNTLARFQQVGPNAEGSDDLTGGVAVCLESDICTPSTPVPFHADILPGLFAVGGIFLGLRARKRAAAKVSVS